MFRLVLLVLYLIASFSMTTDGGSGWDPFGLTTPPPPPSQSDHGAGWDPDG